MPQNQLRFSKELNPAYPPPAKSRETQALSEGGKLALGALGHIPITGLVLIRLAPLSTIACRLWVAAGYPVREVSGGGHRCPTWRRHVLDKAIVVGADRRPRH